MTRTARLFTNGGSQAVRLPAEFRFDGDEVFVRKDERTGDVILSIRHPSDWRAFIALQDRLGVAPDDFLAERDRREQDRDPFADWQE